MENKKELPSSPKGAAPKKGGDSSKGIFITIIVLLLGAVGYLVFDKQQTSEVIAQKVQEHEDDQKDIASKIKEIDDFKGRLETMRAEKEALGLSVDSLNQQIQELEDLKTKLQTRVASLASANARLTKSQASYITMKASFDSLKASNEYLSRLKDSLTTVASTQQESIASLTSKNQENEAKIAIAAKLRAENAKVRVFNQKGKEEKIIPIYKAKTVGKLIISFNIGENAVAKLEDKDIFFRIVEPSGATIFEGEKTFTVDGKESFYTDKQTINFTNSKQNVSFNYTKGSAYKPGKYTIEFFAEGSKIGDTYLTLK